MLHGFLVYCGQLQVKKFILLARALSQHSHEGCTVPPLHRIDERSRCMTPVERQNPPRFFSQLNRSTFL
jgi:hypothetical protein